MLVPEIELLLPWMVIVVQVPQDVTAGKPPAVVLPPGPCATNCAARPPCSWVSAEFRSAIPGLLIVPQAWPASPAFADVQNAIAMAKVAVQITDLEIDMSSAPAPGEARLHGGGGGIIAESLWCYLNATRIKLLANLTCVYNADQESFNRNPEVL